MAGIDRIIIDRILETAKIEEVVGDFIDLKKKGVRYLGLCPFHQDRHLGSFVVYPKGNCYKCFQCGAKGGVVDFLKNHEKLSFPDAIRWLGKKYNIETDMQDFKYTPPPPPRPKPEPLKMLVLPKYIMAKTLLNVDQSTLVRWIKTGINWDPLQRSRIDDVMRDYCVGCSRQGMTVFWQMDEQGRLRTGKMMRYREDGHRDKSQGYNFDWIHSALVRHRDPATGKMTDEPPYPHPDLYNPDRQEMKSCYFGLQLLDRYKTKNVSQTVCIVESEKTAILMAIAYGNNTKQVWMACGGLENLSPEKLAPITVQGRHVILYPDRDGIDKWKAKKAALGLLTVDVDTTPVTKWWREEDGPKADIADVIIRNLNERKPMTTIDEVKAKMPEAEKLIDKLNLTIDNENDRRTNTNEL